MATKDDEQDALERASQVLAEMAGEDVDAIDVKSVEIDEAPFLAKIVSKLSPMVGNLMEQRIVSLLDEHAEDGFSWMRQDPGFPDAILVDQDGEITDTGYEIKAWYVLSTEITGRFKESMRLLEQRNINVVIVAWCMSHMIFGKPKILGVLTVSGKGLAESRDRHYHHPPEYVVEEPQDTAARTANLQQSNVNGYKIQEPVFRAKMSDSERSEADEQARRLKEARDQYRARPFSGEPWSVESQREVNRLMTELTYRLDTNFAKIDRVANADVETFKSEILNEEYLGKTIQEWKILFRDLNGTNDGKREKAEEVIRNLYSGMLTNEAKSEIVVESPDAQ